MLETAGPVDGRRYRSTQDGQLRRRPEADLESLERWMSLRSGEILRPAWQVVWIQRRGWRRLANGLSLSRLPA